LAGEESAFFAQTGFVVGERVSEVNVALEFTIVKFDCYSVMCILIDGPNYTDEIKTQVSSVSTPRSAARLEGLVYPWLPCRVCTSFYQWLLSGVKMIIGSLAKPINLVLCVSSPIIIF